MKAYAIAYVTACLVALGLTPFVIRVAIAGGLVDRPNARKVHRTPTPRVGGIAIAVATAVGFMLLTLCFVAGDIDFIGDRTRAMRLFGAAMCVFIVGLIDDMRSLPAKLKLLALLAAAILACGAGIRIDRLTLGPIDVALGIWSWPLSILWIVAITVAMNFIDGLDGLAAGIAAIACGVIAVIGSLNGNVSTTLLMLSLLGALTGFLVFNYNPARIFMGDSGSMFLGFMVGAASIAVAPAGKTIVGLGLPAMAMSVPLLDCLLTLIRRGVVHRRSIFAAECGHVHHRLLHIGLSHRNAVILLHALSLLGGGIAVSVLFIHHPATAAALVFVPPVVITSVFLLTGSMQVRTSIAAYRRNVNVRRDVKHHRKMADDLQLRIKKAATIQDWWQVVCSAAAALGAVRLEVRLGEQTTNLLAWQNLEPARHAAVAASINLSLPAPASGLTPRLHMDFAGHSLDGLTLRINVLGRLLENEEVSQMLADVTTPLSSDARSSESSTAAVLLGRPNAVPGENRKAGDGRRSEPLYDQTLAATSKPY